MCSRAKVISLRGISTYNRVVSSEIKTEGSKPAKLSTANFLLLAAVVGAVLVAVPTLPALLVQQQTGTSLSTATVQFALAGDAAAIPAQFIGNRIFVPVRLNGGKASLFELDSSSNVTLIDAARAKALDLQIQQSTSAEAQGSGRAVRDCVISLPGVDIKTDSLSVDSKKDFAAQVGRTYEGTLGNDFLARFVIQIDYGRETMELFDPASFHYSGPGTAFPLVFVNGMPAIRAKFSTGARKDIEADFALNTALDASVVISDSYAETHKLFSSHEKTVSALDPELDLTKEVAFGRAKDFRIGPFSLEGTIVEFGQVDALPAGAHLAGEIGGGMLRRFNVVFDYPHRTIILEPNANFHSDDQEDKSGISVIAEGSGLKTFKVVQVQPGTPAEEAGIRQGDEIAGIDDEAAADLTLSDVRNLFRQIGHIYKVLIDRDGKTMEVTMQMRRLLGA